MMHSPEAIIIPLLIIIFGGGILLFALKKSPEIKIKVRFFFYGYTAAIVLQYALRQLLELTHKAG